MLYEVMLATEQDKIRRMLMAYPFVGQVVEGETYLTFAFTTFITKPRFVDFIPLSPPLTLEVVMIIKLWGNIVQILYGCEELLFRLNPWLRLEAAYCGGHAHENI
jgi:hypothetical protein